MAKRESEMRRAPETDETVNKAYKAGTQLQGGRLSEMDPIQLFNDVNIQRTQEGGSVYLDDPSAHQSGEWVPHHTQHTVPRTEEHIPRKPFREEEDTDVVEGIQQIGRGSNEVQDIAGKPITPEDARIIQKKEAICGFPTVKGSLSARAQAAAAANVREHKVDSDAGLSATLR